jgi:hypothetical protein
MVISMLSLPEMVVHGLALLVLLPAHMPLELLACLEMSFFGPLMPLRRNFLASHTHLCSKSDFFSDAEEATSGLFRQRAVRS